MKVALRKGEEGAEDGRSSRARAASTSTINLTMHTLIESYKGRVQFCLAAAALVALGFGPEIARAGEAAVAATPQNGAVTTPAPGPTYLQDVRPIIMGKCARCHNDRATLPNWLDYKTAFNDRAEIKRRIWDSWKGQYYKQSMPAGNGPECHAITEEERALIKEWVLNGAVCGVLPTEGAPKSKEERIKLGKGLFAVVCTPCHQPTGQGIPDKFPPLAQSDFLNFYKNRAIKVLLHGRQGEIVVNGKKFNNSMPSFPLSDGEIASALTYVYNSFGNSGKEVTPEEVKALRAQKEAPGEPKEVAHTTSEPSPFE